ncbi:MAG: radical SAM protein [Desulfobacterales bacterium]|nr:radical SAM protein [Desulfobacterales bacterium]
MPDKIASLYRARLSKEKGTIRKEWGGKLSIALCYPNSYRIGMSSLGFQTIYHLLNRREEVVAERVFLPEGPELSLRLEEGKGLVSLESLSPLQRFDVVAFSLSFENDFPNILRILDLGRIPLLAEERDEAHPLVMAGGVITFLNPEPISPFFDFFLTGEAEPVLDPLLDLLSGLKRSRSPRKEILLRLAGEIPSIYVPSLYSVEYNRDGTIRERIPLQSPARERIEVARLNPLCEAPTISAIRTPDTEFAGRILVELGRGCGRSCRFCAAGYVYRPPRAHPLPEILSSLEKSIKEEKKFGLMAPSISDIPGVDEVTGLILDRGGSFSISSLRADGLTPEMIENLKRSGQKTMTIAPEAGSDRLRKVINKHLSEEQIIEAVGRIASAGQFAVRLYFLIGLPTETREDVNGILDLVKHIKHRLVKESATRGKIGQLRLSINCFIPKSFTPFQWFPMESQATLKEKQKWLKKSLSREGGIKVNFDVAKWANMQAIFSLGDRRAAHLLRLVHEHQGDWNKARRFSEFNPDFFVYRPKDLKEVLPWDFLDHGIRKEHLVKEYKLALKGEESEPCHPGDCIRCGAC